jgi:fumarate hydratase class II
MTSTRQETDSLGEVDVPADKLWGRANSAFARAFQYWIRSHAPRNDQRLRHLEEGRC